MLSLLSHEDDNRISVVNTTVLSMSADAQLNGDLVSADTANPPLGTVFYYVTDGENPCGEGPLDSDPAHPIPNTSPCPTPP